MKTRFNGTTKAIRGFSLIEVTIAMAIAAVGVISLLGLIPQGMGTMRDAGDQAIMGRIHQQILNELQMTPFESPGGMGKSPLDSFHLVEFFFDAQGEEMSDSSNQGSVPEEKKKGSLAHIYSARVSIPSVDGGLKAPESVGGASFGGFSFGTDKAPNPYVRPVVVEVAPVGGLGADFDFDLPDNRRLISTYQSFVTKMGQDYSAAP